MKNNTKIKVVYCITKRDGRSFWNRIGVAYVNSDGSLNVKLDSFPVNGEMQIRDFTDKTYHHYGHENGEPNDFWEES